MSSHNRGMFLADAIDSVLGQTYTNWELIIVDDGSSDKLTIDILEYYGDHPKIHVHYLFHNYGGGIFAKNYALSKAKGDFIAILDDDDIS